MVCKTQCVIYFCAFVVQFGYKRVLLEGHILHHDMPIVLSPIE